MTGWVALLQGAYFAMTAVWPLIDIRSFQRVTGPKTDLWLVRTVAGLLMVIGAALLIGARPGAGGPEAALVVLGMGSAATLMVVDLVYVRRGTIPRIYLADAAAELLLIAGWCVALAVDT